MNKKNRTVFNQMKRRWQLYVFLVLPVIWILIFAYQPMFGVQIAFKDFNPVDGIFGSKWVGLDNFKRFYNSFMFKTTITNTVRISLYSLFVNIPLSIIFALQLNSITNLRYKKFVQTVTYIPHFISTVVLVGIIRQVLNPVTGLYGALYGLFSNASYPVDLLGKAKLFIHIYVWSGIWKNLGWSTIIYIAALSAVSPELHESAEIDGASRFKRVIHIDLPTLLPTASIMLILNAGRIMSVGFEKVFLMQNSLNTQYSEVLSTYVYKVGMTAGGNNYSYSSAISFFNSVINCSMLILVNFICRRMSSTSLF